MAAQTLGAGEASRRSGETARRSASTRRGGLEEKSAQAQKRKSSQRANVVRYSPKNGLKSDIAGGPFRAKPGSLVVWLTVRLPLIVETGGLLWIEGPAVHLPHSLISGSSVSPPRFPENDGPHLRGLALRKLPDRSRTDCSSQEAAVDRNFASQS